MKSKLHIIFSSFFLSLLSLSAVAGPGVGSGPPGRHLATRIIVSPLGQKICAIGAARTVVTRTDSQGGANELVSNQPTVYTAAVKDGMAAVDLGIMTSSTPSNYRVIPGPSDGPQYTIYSTSRSEDDLLLYSQSGGRIKTLNTREGRSLLAFIDRNCSL